MSRILKFWTGIVSLLIAAQPLAGSVSELYRQVSPSMVVLHTYERAPAKKPQSGETMTSARGLGSGVLISGDGRVLTAAHVVHLADSVHVEFHNGDKVLGRVVASDQAADIALLQLDRVPEGMFVASLGDSDQVSVGDDVIVIGAPYGLGRTLTVGYVSGRHEQTHGLSKLRKVELFQTDAAVNQGNSGGPMFNMQGEVIGIVSHILSQSGGFEGIGFAVTANTARRLLIESQGFWSGLDWTLITRRMAAALNVPQSAGILVQRVAQDSPADRAGIRGGEIIATVGKTDLLIGGDVILAVNGIAIEGADSMQQIYEGLRERPRGAPIELQLLRRGERMTVSIGE